MGTARRSLETASRSHSPCTRQTERLGEGTVVPGAFISINRQRHESGYLSGCQSLVAVMQTTELRNCHNLPGTGRLNWPAELAACPACPYRATGASSIRDNSRGTKLECAANGSPRFGEDGSTITWSKHSRRKPEHVKKHGPSGRTDPPITEAHNLTATPGLKKGQAASSRSMTMPKLTPLWFYSNIYYLCFS